MTDVQEKELPKEPAPAVPDYLTDPDAVLKDIAAKWRYGRPPDYSKTRQVYAQTKKMNHAAGSLPELVQNLVKNWEVEASFKPDLSDWRTIDRSNYSFAINGGPPQTAEHMLKVGTYNAIIAPNEYYSPEHSDFATSHKTFKRMMPTFAWEVLEVYSGPPQVAFRWRHWGVMKNDYVGFNDKGEKVTAKAHGGAIDIEGVTVALVDEQVRLQKVETWFDPLEMFRQIAPGGIVNKQPISNVQSSSDGTEESAMESKEDSVQTAPTEEVHRELEPLGVQAREDPFEDAKEVISTTEPFMTEDQGTNASEPLLVLEQPDIATSSSIPDASDSIEPDSIQNSNEVTAQPQAARSRRSSSDSSTWTKISKDEPSLEAPGATAAKDNGLATVEDAPKEHEQENTVTEITQAEHEADQPSGQTPPTEAKTTDQEIGQNGAVAVPSNSEEARQTYEEMSKITPMECPFLMNRE